MEIRTLAEGLQFPEGPVAMADGSVRLIRCSLAQEMETFASAARSSAACLSLGLGVSSVAADRLLAFALGVDEHPALLDVLASGRVDERQARVIQQAGAVLSTDRQAALMASIVTDPEAPVFAAESEA